ncbi:hypothetical protein F7D42_06965 [Prevotella copri]|uniref:Uncharacterized protein n=1 Tax=Segatella copri TaxID=165179 RepID=A0A6A7VL53_9BACT|nr:hypothetical protein [Segatella copri]MQO55452.1 hypothetical protein [Segatella copri]MQO96663.1 hypothetical protein [Segatella copri]
MHCSRFTNAILIIDDSQDHFQSIFHIFDQEKFHEIIIFYKKNIILDLFLRKQEILVTFARKALLGMKIQEVMK